MNIIQRGDALVRLRTRGGRPAPDRRHWIIRPDDLLVLDFALVSLHVQRGIGDTPARLMKAGQGQAYLIVTFPPQHIEEIAYFTTVKQFPLPAGPLLPDPDTTSGDEKPEAPPISCTIAGWSRLVFRVPDDRLPIDWTLDALLKAMRTLELSVPANALPPQPKPSRFSDHLGALITVVGGPKVALASGTGAGFGSLITEPRGSAAATLFPVAGVIAASRARRQIRTAGRALGVSELTGTATAGLPEALIAIAAKPSYLAGLARPEPSPPASTQTALEIPHELFLAPNRFAAWFHVTTPATSTATGHTELWHTRLGVRRADGTLVDGADENRTLRAVWTTAGMIPATPELGKPVETPDHANFPYRTSMDSFDRHHVMHLSSNFQLQDPLNPKQLYEPRPLDVGFLALSSLGAWLDLRGVWDELPLGLSVEEWRHRATLGRDHYVRVVYRGFLFPWGHRASVIKVTERQFEPSFPGNPAYLRQRMFLVVREPLRRYGSSDVSVQYDRMMPFTAVRITTLVSPLLDPPEKDQIAGKAQGCFWPNVGSQPFKFHLVATDVVGNEVEFAMPLIFVGKENADQPHAQSIVPDDVVNKYATDTWPGSAARRAQVPLSGQRMAFAPSATPDDTTFAVQSLTFGAEVPAQQTYDALSALHPRYYPVVRGAQVAVPALQGVARTAQPAAVVFAQRYLDEGFGAANAGQVFLAADPSVPKFEVKFSTQGDRSGGLVTPDLALSGLSRITGPVSGDLAVSAAGSFNPESWFGAITGARLFGALKLANILETVGFNELDKLPKFVGQSLNQVEKVVVDLERLRDRLAVDPVSQTAAAMSLLDQLIHPTTGSIPALVKGGGIAAVVSQLASLNSELPLLQNAIGGSALPPGPRAAIAQAATVLQGQIIALLGATDVLQQFAAGGILPQALQARLEWRPVVKASGPFKPSGTRNLLLAVDAAGEAFSVTCSLDHFILDLEFLELTFERVQFRSVAGKKPEVDVVFTGFKFAGPLSFVETIRELIPVDGFSDPPAVEVTPEGITAGYSVGLPNIAIGVFSLENLALAAGFAVPFVGPPLSVWFRFCERENPARLTVSLFGGGFFFGLTANAHGLAVLEGAIEFGAAASVNLGVASGSVSIMAGLYFKIEASEVTLAGYFRMRGNVEALGLVSVSIELYLEMRYESGSGKCVGTATISVEIEIAMFSTTISITCTKKFAGGNSDPTLAELLDVTPDATSADWNVYCEAFA